MWWFEQEEPEIQYDAQYWAAKATLHEAHVKVLRDVLLDRKWAALGFQRVTNWGYPREDLEVWPTFAHIEKLPIMSVLTRNN